MGKMSDDDNPDTSIAANRSRRQKKDKGGRFAALQRLRDNREKGVKLSYEVEEVKNVYEMVDEADYADEVKKRRDDDWIVDDDGGYVEDGREVFDDDLDDPGFDKKKDKK